MKTSQKTILFCAAILCVFCLFLIPFVKWLPSIQMLIHIVYVSLTLLFFFLVYKLFKEVKLLARIALVLEVIGFVYVCFISLSLSGFFAPVFLMRIDAIYFQGSEDFRHEGHSLIVSEHQLLLPVLTKRLQVDEFFLDKDDLDIFVRNDSIFINNTGNHILYYLKKDIPKWELIKIE